MGNEAAAAKVCSMCGQDVSGKPRSKDAQGQYVCADCLKGKAPAGGSAPAKPVNKPVNKPAKAAAGEENAFLLDLGGKPLAVALCSNCQQPLRPNAKICTLCGFDPEKQETLKTRISKDKAPKERGPKVKKEMGPFGKSFLLYMLIPVVIAGAYVGTGNKSIMMAGLIALIAIGVVVQIRVLFAAFQANPIHAAIAFIFPLWGIYVVYFVQDEPGLKGAYTGTCVGGFLFGLILGIGVSSGMLPETPDNSPPQPAIVEPDGAGPST